MDVIVANDWRSAWDRCHQRGHQSVLFVDSGTVFDDLAAFISTLEPCALRAHIIWRPQDPYPHMDEQCWYANLNYFENYNWQAQGNLYGARRSEGNVHDDYTPWYLSPGKELTDAPVGFGSLLISQVLSQGLDVLNFSVQSRNLKSYFYTPVEHNMWLLKQQPFLERMTEHLWITNNEDLVPVTGDSFIGPASGACWMLNLCRPNVKSATLIDISRRQLEFARWLLDTWDGNDFGTFITHFMHRLKVRSFTLDRDSVDARQLLIRGQLASYVNGWLDAQLERFGISDLAGSWRLAKRKHITMLETDIIPWVLDHQGDLSGLWISNVAEFKYSLMTNDWETIERFNQKCQRNL